MKIPLFTIIVLLFYSCENLKRKEPAQQLPEPEQLKYAEMIVGEWRNSYSKIILHTFKNSDSTKVLEVRESEWETVMQSKPIRTFFKADGTYNSEHRNLEDSIVYNPAGKWRIAGDSLFITDTFPKNGISYTYKISIDNDIAEFKGGEDFDQDGFKDDEYYGSQRRQ
ncbi:MAG: hypothetical protein SH857_04885 [Chitinophagales bacterium]|nr:hypothetical protein [Chitinophagales bacterium]